MIVPEAATSSIYVNADIFGQLLSILQTSVPWGEIILLLIFPSFHPHYLPQLCFAGDRKWNEGNAPSTTVGHKPGNLLGLVSSIVFLKREYFEHFSQDRK